MHRRCPLPCLRNATPAPDMPGPRAHSRRVHREVSRLRPYEVMVIFDAGLEEDAIRAVLDRATDAVRAKGGNPERDDRWGSRGFAPVLRHGRGASSVPREIAAEPEAMAGLDGMFPSLDEVIRH